MRIKGRLLKCRMTYDACPLLAEAVAPRAFCDEPGKPILAGREASGFHQRTGVACVWN